jgi:hypothetical protein
MCGRFTHHLTWEQLVTLYRLTAPRESIAPTADLHMAHPRTQAAARSPALHVLPQSTLLISSFASAGSMISISPCSGQSMPYQNATILFISHSSIAWSPLFGRSPLAASY